MDKLLIKLALLFAPWYRKQGVNTDQLAAILKIKFIIDERRPINLKGTKSSKATRKWSVIMTSIVLGSLFYFIIYTIKQPFIGHALYFSLIMIMLGITLITDFSNVLLDTRDNFIILPKPVNNITFLFSRILHIALYVLKLAFMLTAAGVLLTLVTEGIVAGLIFILEVLISAILTLLLVNIIYIALLKFSKPEKFKDYISYIQVLFGIIIFGLNAFLPRLFTGAIIDKVNILKYPAIWLLPPMWISSLHEILKAVKPDFMIIAMASAAVISPIVAIYLLVKVLGPGFNKQLAGLAGSASAEESKPTEIKKAAGKNLNQKLSNLLCFDSIEKAGFRITWALSSRLREFRVKVYPSFAYVIINFLLITIQSGKNLSMAEKIKKLPETKAYIMLTYFTCFILINVFQHLSYSEKYKSAWIYFTAPLPQPGKILGGMFKAVLTKFFAPFFLIIAIFTLTIWGIPVINDLFLAFTVCLFYGLLISLLIMKGMPFSKPAEGSKAAGRSFLSFLLLVIPAGIGAAHYQLANWELTIWGFAIFMTMLICISYRYYIKESWDSLEFTE